MNGERWGGKSEGPLTFSYWSQHRNISEAMNYLQLPWFILQPISPHLGRKMEVVKFQTAPTPVFRLLRHRRGGGTRGWAGESIRWRGQVGAEGKRTEETEPGAEGGGSSSRNDRGTTEAMGSCRSLDSLTELVLHCILQITAVFLHNGTTPYPNNCDKAIIKDPQGCFPPRPQVHTAKMPWQKESWCGHKVNGWLAASYLWQQAQQH